MLAALTQRALTRGAAPVGGMRAAASGGAAGAALALAGSAAVQFHRQGTTVDPLDPALASSLVTSGANAVTRNPMYVGMAGLLLAHAVRRGSWAALLPVAGFVTVIDRTQVPAEEEALSSHFGADYERYRSRVPRWLGRRSATATRHRPRVSAAT
jgi:protein-S-isoprenylcysteine O-methyltransferase Ste14